MTSRCRATVTPTEPRHDEKTRAERPSGRRLVAALLVWIATSVTAGFATASIANAMAPEWTADPHNLAVVIVAEVYALLVASLLITFRGSRLETALAIRPVGGREVWYGILVWAAAYLVAFIGYGLVESVGSPDPSILEVLAGVGSDAGRLANAGIWPTMLILGRVLVLVPLGEELLFRGALFGWLRRRLPSWTTIGITSVLWALIHQIPIMMPLALVVGVAAGWVRERTGSVIPVIVAHTVQNVIVALTALALTGWTAPLPY